MGLFDFIRRRRLTQKGLSSGKKRRTQTDGLVASTLDRSHVVRFGIYAVFGALLSVMVLLSSGSTGFRDLPAQGILVALVVLAMMLAVFHLSHPEVVKRNGNVLLVFGGIAAHLAVVRGVAAVVELNGFDASLKLLLIPFALAPMIHGVLLGQQVGIYSVGAVSLFGCFLVPQESMLTYLVMSLVGGLSAVFITRQVRKRGRLLRAGLAVGAVALVLGYVFDLIAVGPLFSEGMGAWKLFGIKSGSAFITGVATGMVVSALLPLLEGVFAVTSGISWLELSDLNHKLLRRMQLEAPGTFHHSLVVASLSEAAAEAIGADAMVCRVSSYFHDIGKLNKPDYFVENQGDENPHDSLTPTMSALIIVAHVKDGVDMAIKHKLNPRVIDVIREHHGDSLVYYFYRKAQEKLKEAQKRVDEGSESTDDLPELDENNFRYPGPRPRSKESGIISLADAVESASRSLQKPTPQKIRTLINDIVFNRIKDGQLNDCGLTLSELNQVRASFSKTLRSMLHSRIEYPKQGKKTETKGGAAPEEATEAAAEKAPAGKAGGKEDDAAAKVVPVEELERQRKKKAAGQS
ncbi:MAG: HDIG domain-containing protein [Akkermansiaceae bacterium]|nr:HDIG domain-containing protein [Akkermansiaceae bacterium]NNM29717.1 HDIG domain-containing protein [Akkermansiaceae bacterium]